MNNYKNKDIQMLLKFQKKKIISRVNLTDLPLSVLLNYYYSCSIMYPAKQLQI